MNITEERIVNKVKQSILSIDKDAEIILFGSRARDDSDWDFLFLTNEKVTFPFRMEISRKMLRIELEEDVVLQVVPKNKIDWQGVYFDSPFYRNVKDDGVIL